MADETPPQDRAATPFGGPPMTPEEFRAARDRLGLSLSELARALNVNPRTVCRWQDGSQAVPGPVAAAIGMKLRSLERDG